MKKHSISNTIAVSAFLLATTVFLFATQMRQPPSRSIIGLNADKVVLAAPIQIMMYAGDRFLAADVEAIRVAAIGPSEEESLTGYRIRAHELVAQLNPCHEDNVYLSNAMLGWGGSVDEGMGILERATDCRYWDEIPPFFLGFNRYFFHRDIDGAKEAIDIAASRSEDNRATLEQMSIVIGSKKLNDKKMAAVYLRNQRDEATDPILKEKLNRRIKRLEGLFALQNAQEQFEKKYRRPLANPQELLSSGILDSFPQDPLRIGYEFTDGRFRMRAMIIGGTEIRQ